MKKYLMPIMVLFLVVMGCYYLFDESQRSFNKSRSAYEMLQIQVENARKQRDASTDQIVALNKSVKDSVDFLAKWKSYYLSNRDSESLVSKVAEKTKCVVVERKWESKKENLGKLDYPVEAFAGTVVGDYRDIVAFVGELESQQQLLTIGSMEFKEGIGGVTCTLNFWLPRFALLEGGAR